MTLEEVCSKTTRKILDNIDSVELTKQYPHIKEALEAFMSDSNTFLLIAVVSGKTTAKIYFFTKQNQTPTSITIDTTKKNEIMEVYTKIRKKMKAEKSDCTQKDIIDSGNELFQKLLEGVLPEKPDKEYGVWIYCEDKQINPLWEWICVKSEDESSENSKYFFWGDRFFIVRIPTERIPETYKSEDSKFKIEEVDILLDTNSSNACSDRKCLRELGIVDNEIDLNKPDAQNNLKASDCIHIAADIELFIHHTPLLNALKASKDMTFLFLNIWGPGVSRGMHIMKWINVISAKTRIYPILNVPPDFAPIFAKCFYECVAKEKNVAEAVRKTREEIEKGYLFCITDGDFKKDLNMCIIPEKLREKFNDEGSPVSNDVTITKENDKWTITDEENIYTAREKDGKLKIYEKERNSGCKKFWRLAYVVKGNP